MEPLASKDSYPSCMVERADQRREMGEPSQAVLSSTHDIGILLRFFLRYREVSPQEVHSWTGRWIHRRYWQKGNGGTLKFRMLWVVLKSVRAWPWGVSPATCQSCHPCSLALQVSAVVGDSVTWHPGRGFPSPCWNPRRWANSTLSFTN